MKTSEVSYSLLVIGIFFIAIGAVSGGFNFGPIVLGFKTGSLIEFLSFWALSSLGLFFIGMSFRSSKSHYHFTDVRSSFIVKKILGEKSEYAVLDIDGKSDDYIVEMNDEDGRKAELPDFKVGQRYIRHNDWWVKG